MNEGIFYRIFTVFFPLLLHMAASETVAAVFGLRLDASGCAAVTSLLVLFPSLWMYWNDRKLEEDSGRNTSPAGTKGVCRGNWKQKTNRGQRRRIALLPSLACVLGGGLMNAVWSSALQAAGIQKMFSNETQERLLSGDFLVQLISLAVLVPLAEELIFRGLMYRRMRRFLTAGMAVPLSALLFALYHGNPIQIIFAFPMAVVLALVMEKGNWLGYPVLLHMGSNLAAVLVSRGIL